MKEKKLLRALGNVDNQYIKEAEPMKKTGKRSDKIFTRNLHKKSIFVVPSQSMTCYNQHGNKNERNIIWRKKQDFLGH